MSDGRSEPASLRDVEALDDKIEVRIKGVEREIEIRAEATMVALELSASAVDVKFEQFNNLRSQVTEDRRLYVTQERYDVVTTNVETRLLALEQGGATDKGDKSGKSAVTTGLAIIAGLALQAAVLWFATKGSHP